MPAKHDLLRILEEDSASTLYLAKDKKRGTECWMRRFKTRKAEEIDGLKELFSQLAPLEDPHLEKALEFGTDKEGFFAITAPLEGETLEQTLQRGPLTAEEFEIVARQLLHALDSLHEQAIVHGSVRADYVRIAGTSPQDWQVTLGGFGQGFAMRGESKEAQIRAYRCTAPEQWQDGTTRRRTDVYALGCVLYEALAARPPFDGRALKELRIKHLGHDVAPLEKLASHVPAWMCRWVMRLLAADPEQRPRKAAAARELFEMREALPAAEAPRPEAPAPAAAPLPAPAPGPAAAGPLAQPVSAPVVLPASQTLVRNVTSSTIPISAAPRGRPAAGPPSPGRRPSSASIPVGRSIGRPAGAGMRGVPGGSSSKLTRYLLLGGTAVALGGIFILSRCGAPPPAPKPPPPAKHPTSGAKKK